MFAGAPNLKDAKLDNLRGAVLKGADLSGVDLSGTDLTSVDLTGGKGLKPTILGPRRKAHCQRRGAQACVSAPEQPVGRDCRYCGGGHFLQR